MDYNYYLFKLFYLISRKIGVELVKQPKDKKPVKGKRRWTKLPEVIDTVRNLLS